MTVDEFMLKSGIRMGLKGYDVTKRAIELQVKYPEKTISEITMVIAQEKSKSYDAITRNMRSAVVECYGKMDDSIKKIFQGEEPTAGKFVKTVAYALSNNLL